MNSIFRILDTSIGQKVVAGATGLALVAFLLIHMAGNLQIFAGAEALNKYAELLKSEALILWGARLGLLGLIVLHIVMTVRQRLRNRGMRERQYAQRAYQRTTSASRSMMITGTLLLAFIVFHLLHFTVGAILPDAHAQVDSEGRHDVFSMVVMGFQNPLIVVVYIVGMLALTTHLVHAISSALQTLGLVQLGQKSTLKKLSPLLVAVIILGFLAVPLSVAFGFVGS